MAFGLTRRDQRIIELARGKLAGAAHFDEAVRALADAVAEVIPAGRVYVLGGGAIGSLISGIGIVDGVHGVQLVDVRNRVILGRFA
ncbi:MAG: hypothetical protein ABI867_38805 [Kofleriaceae bacterium]